MFVPKSVDWYWSLAIITVAFLAIGLYQKNFLFVILILIGSFLVLFFAVRKPQRIKITISGAGVRINDRVYPFDTLKSFWIFYRPGGNKELSLLSEKMIMPQIKIPLADTDPNIVRDFIIEYLPEESPTSHPSFAFVRV